MLLVVVAVALPYPQDAAAPVVAAPAEVPVPGADGEKVDERHRRPHGGYGGGYNQGYGGGYNQGYGGYNQGYGGYNQGYGNNYNSKHKTILFI